MAAKECEDTRDMFGGAAAAHAKTTYKRNGQIYDAFNTAARNFRRGVDFSKLNEYNVIYDAAGGIQSDIRGMTQWSSPEVWMDEAESKAFSRCTSRIISYYSLIQHALYNGLKKGVEYIDVDDLNKDLDEGFPDSSIVSDFSSYNTEDKFGWQLPSPVPNYAIDQSITVKTTEVCPWTGVWYPDTGLERHSLVFAIQGLPMPPAFHCDKTMEELAATNGKAYSDDIETTAVETTWHPVRLTESATQIATLSSEKLRCEANKPCPRNGYWWTPAKEHSRRYFQQNEIMPDFPNSTYGKTIWQWDANQS